MPRPKPPFADHSTLASVTVSGTWNVTAPTELSPTLTLYFTKLKRTRHQAVIDLETELGVYLPELAREWDSLRVPGVTWGPGL